jgi:hypothetical protein
MKKLLIILGAGSSISLGMPSVSALDEATRRWAEEWGVYDGERYRPNYYEYAWQALSQHFQDAPRHLMRAPNFELALGLLVGLSNWVIPRPHGKPLRDMIEHHGTLPPFFSLEQLPPVTPDTFGPSLAVEQQYLFLIEKLAARMREQCARLADNTIEQRSNYRALIDALRAEFDVGIYNLNYDNVAMDAWSSAFTGFSEKVDTDGCRAFDPLAVHTRREWGFIYHLHGSVHHTLATRDQRHGIFSDGIRWRDDLMSSLFVDANPGASSILDERSDGNEIPLTTIIAGGYKLDQMLAEPFHSFYASLVRHAHEADAILIGGYGFGDTHVNRALLSRATSPEVRPPVLILERTSSNQQSTGFRNDGWTRRITKTLAISPGSFQPVIPGTIARLLGERLFEVAAGHTAIWHNGFLEIADRLPNAIEWLDGKTDAISISTLTKFSRCPNRR